MSLDLAMTLTPADLQSAFRDELHEYLVSLNETAKAMGDRHLAWPMRHAQINAVLSELERRDVLAILAT